MDACQPDFGPPPPVALPVTRRLLGRSWYQDYSCYIDSVGVPCLIDTSNCDAVYVADLEPDLPPLSTTERAELAFGRSKHSQEDQETLRRWRAQCAFRGLSVFGDLATVQARLRQNLAKRLKPESQRLLAEMVEEYRKVNKPKADALWDSLSDNRIAKIHFWARRLLIETFFISGAGNSSTRASTDLATPKVLMVEVNNWLALEARFRRAVVGLPLYSKPLSLHYHQSQGCLLIISPSRDEVERKAQEKSADSERVYVQGVTEKRTTGRLKSLDGNWAQSKRDGESGVSKMSLD